MNFSSLRKYLTPKYILAAIVAILLLLIVVMYFLKGEAYRLSLQELTQNEMVSSEIGMPIEVGYFISGSISSGTSGGYASLQYSITGSKSKGTVYVKADKKYGKWKLTELVVNVHSTNNLIKIVGEQ